MASPRSPSSVCRCSSTPASTTSPRRFRAAEFWHHSQDLSPELPRVLRATPISAGRRGSRWPDRRRSGQRVPFGRDLLFASENEPGLVVGAEISEDGWVQISPNAYQTSAGATVCGNLSASNFTVGKGELRHRLCWKASDPGKCAYIYTAAGPGEVVVGSRLRRARPDL